MPEGRRVFDNLTVMENFRIGAYLSNDREEIEAGIEGIFQHFPRLKEREWQFAGTLAGGEQQMLTVGRVRPWMCLFPLFFYKVIQHRSHDDDRQ